MTDKTHENASYSALDTFLSVAIEEAYAARREGTAPAGAVVVSLEGELVARGHNRIETAGDATAHAEIDAIRRGGPRLIGLPTNGAHALYTTSEPCLMCLGAILRSSVRVLVWIADSTSGGSYDAIRRAGLWPDEMGALQVIREPSISHRATSRALLHEYFLERGDLRRAAWLSS
jgi:tRNA(adenine34) deaminase